MAKIAANARSQPCRAIALHNQTLPNSQKQSVSQYLFWKKVHQAEIAFVSHSISNPYAEYPPARVNCLPRSCSISCPCCLVVGKEQCACSTHMPLQTCKPLARPVCHLAACLCLTCPHQPTSLDVVGCKEPGQNLLHLLSARALLQLTANACNL